MEGIVLALMLLLRCSTTRLNDVKSSDDPQAAMVGWLSFTSFSHSVFYFGAPGSHPLLALEQKSPQILYLAVVFCSVPGVSQRSLAVSNADIVHERQLILNSRILIRCIVYNISLPVDEDCVWRLGNCQWRADFLLNIVWVLPNTYRFPSSFNSVVECTIIFEQLSWIIVLMIPQQFLTVEWWHC